MARAAISTTSIPDTGYNFTDGTGTTLSTGAGNGGEIDYDANTRIYLTNPTGGSSTWTIKIPTPTSYSALSVTIPDMSITIATGKTYVLKPAAVFRQADGKIYIDCSVAGKLLVLN